MRVYPLASLWAALAFAPSPGATQERLGQIRPVTGMTLVSTLQFPEGDREDLIELRRVDSTGIHYVWRFTESWHDRDTVADVRQRLVRANDLAGAPRLDPIFASSDDLERPGYTAFSLSSAVFVKLRDQGSAHFTMTRADTAAGIIAAAGVSASLRRARYKGMLTRMDPKPGQFALLVDGRRVTVPALRLRGEFTNGVRGATADLWVLADSAHPLLLKSVVDSHVFQIVRVDFPVASSGRGAAGGGELNMAGRLERQLVAACRVELPGVYFAFNSAFIDPTSDRALAQLAAVLARHPEWSFTVEGHTDSIGIVAANQKLSQHRADALLSRLAERHRVETHAWKATGFGASRPRESNATVEGRARNRRVELVRACPEKS